MKKEILVVDDKIKVCESLAKNFSHVGYKAYCATTGKDAVRILGENRINAIILDVVLGEENGIELLKNFLDQDKHIPVIMITGYASIESAVESIKIGAFDYLKKPVEFDQLLKVVENAMHVAELKKENRSLKNIIHELSLKIISKNVRMLELMDKAKKLSQIDIPILICGENGTGKELLADFIHANSPRVSHMLHKVNCATFPEHLLDNELFGHERGAYTGADASFKGVFERADMSTLFLDEIGDMSLTIQAKILRTLQNKEIRRLGGSSTINVDVRFIAATNRNLETLMQKGKFREDLYYRLSAAILSIPPLRSRKEDIPLLSEQFMTEFSRINPTKVKGLTNRVMDRFMEYHWPGNIRELRNTIHYACAITIKDYVDTDDLPGTFLKINKFDGSQNIREESEKNLILRVLRQHNNNKKKAAETLTMSRRTLYNKLVKYGIKNETG